MQDERDLSRVVSQPLADHGDLPQQATGTSEATLPEMREWDVFSFSYNAEARAKIFESDHCFDGQLVYREGLLIDTYWGFDVRGDMGRRFTLAEAHAKGSLTFVCNLNETEPISEWLFPQYDEADRFNLCHQHGCYKKFAIRKGATKSLANRLEILDARVKDAKHTAERAMQSAFHEIEFCQAQRRRLEDGEDISV